MKSYVIAALPLVLAATLLSAASALGQTPAKFSFPTNFHVTAGADTCQVLWLSWQDNASSESAYEIDRSSTGKGETFLQIASLPKDSTTYTDNDVVRGSTYWYRVAAVSPDGFKAFSQVEHALATCNPFPLPATSTPVIVMPSTGSGPANSSESWPFFAAGLFVLGCTAAAISVLRARS